METQLFTWEEVDFVTELIMVFYKVTRTSDNAYFPIANLNYEEGTVEYLNENGAILEQHELILTSRLVK